MIRKARPYAYTSRISPTEWALADPGPDTTHTLLFTPGGDTLAVRTVLCVDISGSMTFSHKLDNAKRGAKVQVDLLKSTDHVGLVTFNDIATVDFPLAPATPANKAVRELLFRR